MAKHDNNGHSASICLALILGLSAGIANEALAQGTGAEGERDVSEVVVTGSRIRGINPVGSSVIGLDRTDIEEVGAPTTADLMRKLPVVVGIGPSETTSTAQLGAVNVTRSSTVNLRGIGPSATLVLLNGRRLPLQGQQGGLSDPSVFPTIALERMEVVADGGSAVYGSDAVTGVVNMIPRTQFVGQQTQARYGFSSGYHDASIAHLAGFNWENGRLVLAGSYNEHPGLKGSARDFYGQDLRARGGSDFRSQLCAPGNILLGTTSYAIPSGGVTPATRGSLVANTRNLCDSLQDSEIIPEQKRLSGYASFEQDLTPGLTVFAQGLASFRDFVQTARSAGNSMTVTSANPFYVHPTGGTGNITVQYDLLKGLAPLRTDGHADLWQAIVGVRQALPADWRLEAYASYGEGDDALENRLLVDATELAIALRDPNPATALNPFGSGVNNPATLAKVFTGQNIMAGKTELTVYSAQGDGPLFDMAGGAVRAAIGGEYRKEALDGLLTTGTPTVPLLNPAAKDRYEWAIFSELFVPFVGASNEFTAVQRLDLSLAARYEWYEGFGSAVNPKIGVNWTPVSGLDLRASWGKSFRAPTLAESDDRASGWGLYPITIACNRPGPTCNGMYQGGGNSAIGPEKATTWSAGFNLHPERLQGFTATLNYFNIDYKNQIVNPRQATDVLTNPAYARFVQFNPTQAEIQALLNSGLIINRPIDATQVTFILDGRRTNLGVVQVSGFDFDIDQRFSTSFGRIDVGIAGTLFTEAETAIAPGAPVLSVLNRIDWPPRFRARGSLGWSGGAFSARAFINYLNSYQFDAVTGIDSYTTVDLHLGYDLRSKDGLLGGVSLAIDVNNVVDQDPSFLNRSPGYDSQAASPLGRVVALSLSKEW